MEAVNRDTEAESACRKALELEPRAPFRHLRIGRSLLLQAKAEAALREVQQEKDEVWRFTVLPLAFDALGRRSESDAALAALKSKSGCSARSSTIRATKRFFKKMKLPE